MYERVGDPVIEKSCREDACVQLPLFNTVAVEQSTRGAPIIAWLGRCVYRRSQQVPKLHTKQLQRP